MTLQEAIAHAKEKASEQRRRFEDIYGQEETTEAERKEAIACLDCSNEHGQLAAWLEELQERREADKKLKETLEEMSGRLKDSLFGDGIRFALKIIGEQKGGAE